MHIRMVLGFMPITIVLSTHALYKEPITTRVGNTFTIKLASAPTTGLDWFFGNDKVLKDYVQLVKSEFISSPSIVSGRIGKKIFTFKALKDGKIKIKLIKRKSWKRKRSIMYLSKYISRKQIST